ncbi:MAG: hypothetical protein OK457_03705 [Thaumarchaeota archaeon]|nr:hypothetical protein [Nitrososphaerota archaeon]
MNREIRVAVTYSVRAKIAYEIALGLSGLDFFRGDKIIVTNGVQLEGLNDLGGPLLLEKEEQDLVFLNPSSISYMASNGKGPYDHPVDLRVIAVFPSWDRLCFAAKKDLNMATPMEISQRKLPLKLSTRAQNQYGSTAFALNKVLNYYQCSIEYIEKMGGQVDRVVNPRDNTRIDGIKHGMYDLVFDEDITGWGETALENGMVFLELDEGCFRMMEELGFCKKTIPRSKFSRLEKDVEALEFGGWPLCCRADKSEDVVYHITEAIDRRKESIVADGSKVNMRNICRDTEEGPLCISLHPGAERYYKEFGYL